jgi:TolB-like protein/class 3 adenylate cyclase/rhodanese-related sulfurtransferase
MAMSDLSGKLVVILHADIAGSTRLVHRDEQLAHERIRDAFRGFSDMISSYHGRVRELRGDALLAEFERASDAVTAALAFQTNHSALIRESDDNIKAELRVGIALGEVVIADGTVTGAGVVLAQRVEQLAEPGGLNITSAIHEALPSRLPFSYKNLGEQTLKGFDNLVTVYSVRLASDATVPPPSKKAKQVAPIQLWKKISIACVVLLLFMGIGYWVINTVPPEEPVVMENMAYPLPDKPSLAVLPFTNLSDVTEQEYFVDGLNTDLITDLSRISGLFVIARNSVVGYKEKEVKIRTVAEELGVRYVMDGSVERVDNKVRINARLVDATTGGHVWGGRYDGNLDDLLSMRDTITRKIVSALSVTLTSSEVDHGDQGETSIPEANDAFLRGRALYQLFTPDDIVKAIPFLEKAIELDPEFGHAHVTLAAVYWGIYTSNWAEKTGVSYDEALRKTNYHLEKAMTQPTPIALQILSRQHTVFGHWEEAIQAAEQAIALDPNDPNGYAAMGRLLVRTGEAARSLNYIKKAMRLDPLSDYLFDLASAQFDLERFDEAAVTFSRGTRRNPHDEWNFFYLAATYGHLGRTSEAEAAFARFDDLYRHPTGPDRPFTLAHFETWTYQHEPNKARVREGLRKAGVPTGEVKKPDTGYLELISVTEGTFNVSGAVEIDAERAKTLNDGGAVFIDSRGKSAYERGHIPGAIHLPLHEVQNNLTDLVGQDAQVVFYCDNPNCHLAAHASARALTQGFTRVYYFAGGILAWENAKHPIAVP